MIEQSVCVWGCGGGVGCSMLTEVGGEAVWPLSSATLQVTVIGPAGAPDGFRVAVLLLPLIWPEEVEEGWASGPFWGLTPCAVIVELSPGLSVVGFAEQLMVGGSNCLTSKFAVQSANSPAFCPCETWP